MNQLHCPAALLLEPRHLLVALLHFLTVTLSTSIAANLGMCVNNQECFAPAGPGEPPPAAPGEPPSTARLHGAALAWFAGKPRALICRKP